MFFVLFWFFSLIKKKGISRQNKKKRIWEKKEGDFSAQLNLGN
jgi:hypothetical protein